jgi:hypothetical protein
LVLELIFLLAFKDIQDIRYSRGTVGMFIATEDKPNMMTDGGCLITVAPAPAISMQLRSHRQKKFLLEVQFACCALRLFL